jgi:hypothetical protein
MPASPYGRPEAELLGSHATEAAQRTSCTLPQLHHLVMHESVRYCSVALLSTSYFCKACLFLVSTINRSGAKGEGMGMSDSGQLVLSHEDEESNFLLYRVY